MSVISLPGASDTKFRAVQKLNSIQRVLSCLLCMYVCMHATLKARLGRSGYGIMISDDVCSYDVLLTIRMGYRSFSYLPKSMNAYCLLID